jgi:hypothetical protein
MGPPGQRALCLSTPEHNGKSGTEGKPRFFFFSKNIHVPSLTVYDTQLFTWFSDSRFKQLEINILLSIQLPTLSTYNTHGRNDFEERCAYHTSEQDM